MIVDDISGQIRQIRTNFDANILSLADFGHDGHKSEENITNKLLL